MAQRSKRDANVLGKAPGALECIDATNWTRIEFVSALIRPTLESALPMSEARNIADQLNIHWTSVYRYRRRLLAAGTATALLGRVRGYPTGSSRLSPEQESVIEKVIARLARRAKKLRVIDVFEEVVQRCRISNIPPPSRRSVDRRLERQAPAMVARRNVDDGRQTTAASGTFIVRKPFEVVQIDHTKCDILIVDDLYRTSIGRPWLSVAMDIASRAILAILVTFEPPSAATVALLITRIVHENSVAQWA
jgi:putative transposase